MIGIRIGSFSGINPVYAVYPLKGINTHLPVPGLRCTCPEGNCQKKEYDPD
jgi:hypothetical protein